MDIEADVLCRAVDRRNRESLRPGVVGAEILNSGVVDRIGVVAVGLQRHRAEVAWCRDLASLERGLILVGVEDGQLPGRRQLAVLGDVVIANIADGRAVVLAVDCERDILGAAVLRDDRERIDLGFAGSEILRGVVGDGVGVAAVGREVQRAEIARPCEHAGLERGLARVRVADRDAAHGGQIPGVVRRKVFRHIGNGGIADRRRVVAAGRAVNGEADLFGGAIDGGHGEGIDLDGTGRQIMRSAFGHDVNIAAVARQQQEAEVAGSGANGRLERRFALINVRDSDAAGCGEHECGRIVVDIVNRGCADHRRVIDALDDERDLLGRAVERLDGEGFDLGVARTEILHGAVGDRIVVGAVGIQRQCAQIALPCDHAGLERGLVLVGIRDRDRA